MEFVAFLKQAGLEGETSHNEEQLKSANIVFGYCQKLLVKSKRGELKISSKNCEGTLFFHDGAIVSGNSVVHHFSTLGTLSFISGGCRVPHDVPPYMLAAGSDNPTIKTVNVVGMRRQGISEETISVIKQAHRLIFREHKQLDKVIDVLHNNLEGVLPYELSTLLSFIKCQRRGKMGRAREVGPDQASSAVENAAPTLHRRAA